MSEYVRIELPELKPYDAEIAGLQIQIDALQAQIRQVQIDRQVIIDAEALKIARFKVGDKFISRGRTHVITQISGEYIDSVGTNMPSIVLVRYKGHVEFKMAKPDAPSMSGHRNRRSQNDRR